MVYAQWAFRLWRLTANGTLSALGFQYRLIGLMRDAVVRRKVVLARDLAPQFRVPLFQKSAPFARLLGSDSIDFNSAFRRERHAPFFRAGLNFISILAIPFILVSSALFAVTLSPLLVVLFSCVHDNILALEGQNG